MLITPGRISIGQQRELQLLLVPLLPRLCDHSCAICLSDYEKGQGLRFLPCKHHFHAECVDKYLPPSLSLFASPSSSSLFTLRSSCPALLFFVGHVQC